MFGPSSGGTACRATGFSNHQSGYALDIDLKLPRTRAVSPRLSLLAFSAPSRAKSWHWEFRGDCASCSTARSGSLLNNSALHASDSGFPRAPCRFRHHHTLSSQPPNASTKLVVEPADRRHAPHCQNQRLSRRRSPTRSLPSPLQINSMRSRSAANTACVGSPRESPHSAWHGMGPCSISGGRTSSTAPCKQQRKRRHHQLNFIQSRPAWPSHAHRLHIRPALEDVQQRLRSRPRARSARFEQRIKLREGSPQRQRHDNLCPGLATRASSLSSGCGCGS